MSIFTRSVSKIYTRPVLEVNLNKIIENYRLLCDIIYPSTPSAVIKDDAYGLDAAVVAKTLYEGGNCRHFWVAHAVEGEKIAEFVPGAQIFVLQGIGEDSAQLFAQYKFTPVISSPEMFAFWKKQKISDVKPVIQVETGLNRLGFRTEDLEHLSAADLKMFSMVISHLACADEKDHFMNKFQLDNFNKIRQKYFPALPASLSASDGAFLGADYTFNMVRLGAAIYGINTAPYRLNQMQNVVVVKAPVLQITQLKKGDFVGYSATYRAGTDKKIAIISIGYGDGIPRSLSNRGKIFFRIKNEWKEAKIIGRVSMDNIICDITGLDLKVGEWGYIIFDEYPLDDVARDAQTISYELLSNIGKNQRFDRVYIIK